jgi:ubiquitin C-terminal hydrolase
VQAQSSAAVNPQDSLGQALGDFRGAVAGEQEDAEEFFAFFLCKLHEEVEHLVKKGAHDAETQVRVSPLTGRHFTTDALRYSRQTLLTKCCSTRTSE